MKNIQKFGYMALGAVIMLILSLTVPVLATGFEKQITAYFNDIKINMDGVLITPKDASGNIVEPFIVDGTTYLPVRAICEAIGKTVEWVGEENTVYVGKTPSNDPVIWIDEMNILAATGNWLEKPVSWGQRRDNTDTAYEHGIYFRVGYMNKAEAEFEYLLNQKFSKFNGTIVLLDNYKDYEGSGQIKMYVDEKLVFTSDLIAPGFLPTGFSVDLKGAVKLKIVAYMVDARSNGHGYGIVNSGFYE